MCDTGYINVDTVLVDEFSKGLDSDLKLFHGIFPLNSDCIDTTKANMIEVSNMR